MSLLLPEQNRFRDSTSSSSFLRFFSSFIQNFRKTPVPETLFSKVADLRPATLLKRSLGHRCFPANFAIIPGASFLKNTYGRLLLSIYIVSFLLVI